MNVLFLLKKTPTTQKTKKNKKKTLTNKKPRNSDAIFTEKDLILAILAQ